MITSMTGFGRAEGSNELISVTAEVRSVNSRYLEVQNNLSRRYMSRENDLRELLRKRLHRGKVNVNVSVARLSGSETLKVNTDGAKAYVEALNDVRKSLKIRETVKLDHVIQYPDLLITGEDTETLDEEWSVITKTVLVAVDKMLEMRSKEGKELAKDMNARIRNIEQLLGKIEKMTTERIPQERQRLRERIGKLFESDEMDEQRLEMEIVILADKLDISEECVRMRAHIKYFGEVVRGNEQGGRKINFLLQEMNREVNTMGSKSNDSEIAHHVVEIKEELERVREQVQNIE